MFYSASTKGFYALELHGTNMPADVVEITAEEHLDLLNGQSDGKVIAADEAGRPVLVDPPAPTDEQVVAGYVYALEAHYDAVARGRRYDNRLTCALRAGYPGPFQAEGSAFAVWMDEQNAYAYEQLALVQAGDRDQPSHAELIAELAPMVWPA